MRWAVGEAESGFSTETPVEFGESGDATMWAGRVCRLGWSSRSARARSSHFPLTASRLPAMRWEGVQRGLGEFGWDVRSRRRVWYANERGSMAGCDRHSHHGRVVAGRAGGRGGARVAREQGAERRPRSPRSRHPRQVSPLPANRPRSQSTATSDRPTSPTPHTSPAS